MLAVETLRTVSYALTVNSNPQTAFMGLIQVHLEKMAVKMERDRQTDSQRDSGGSRICGMGEGGGGGGGDSE